MEAILPFSKIPVNLDNIMFSKIIQAQEGKQLMISKICVRRRGWTQKKQQSNNVWGSRELKDW